MREPVRESAFLGVWFAGRTHLRVIQVLGSFVNVSLYVWWTSLHARAWVSCDHMWDVSLQTQFGASRLCKKHFLHNELVHTTLAKTWACDDVLLVCLSLPAPCFPLPPGPPQLLKSFLASVLELGVRTSKITSTAMTSITKSSLLPSPCATQQLWISRSQKQTNMPSELML